MKQVTDRQILTDGQVVFREGQPASIVYLIAHGEVELLKVDENNKMHPISTSIAGDFIGVKGLVDAKNYTATAKVKGAATIIPIAREKIDHELSKLDKLTLNIISSTIKKSDTIV